MTAPSPANTHPATHTVTLPPELAEIVKQKAKIERSTPEAVIRFCIDQTLQHQEAQNAPDRKNAAQNQ